MKERPMPMSAPMVRSVLAGTKTQTRRIVKPRPVNLSGPNHDGLWSETIDPVTRYFGCLYGVAGDRLWVREEHHITLRDPRAVSVRYLADGCVVSEVTIGAREHALFLGRKHPDAVTRARFMWRCLSRITLEIVSVRVERLQAITPADAIAEGIERIANGGWRDYLHAGQKWMGEPGAAVESYRSLWESINGAGSWALNPWVWVVEFRRVEA